VTSALCLISDNEIGVGYRRRAGLREECPQKATELAQAVADVLFALPPNEDRDGPIVRLQPPTTRLPREKHVRRVLISTP
jgi:hypothetical protein